MSLQSLPGLDLSAGTFTLPIWAIAVASALVVALLFIAVMRAGMTEFSGLAFRIIAIVIAVVLGWTYVQRTSERDRADERRALDQRSTELIGHAIAPGSPIACLEATSSETVEGACERGIFATPETVAAATAYIGARLTLLADAADYVNRKDQSYEPSLSGLRRTVQADRFGLVSQVLATRDGCTADVCDAFSLVYDDKKLRANLKERAFDVTLARYAVNWPSRPVRPAVSSVPPPSPSSLSSPSSLPPPAPSAVVNPPSSNLSFPSSQSIPPVSIMNAEPTTPPPPERAPPPAERAPPTAERAPPPSNAAAAEPAPPAPTKSAPVSAPRRPPPARQQSKSEAPPPPVQLGPPPAATAGSPPRAQ